MVAWGGQLSGKKTSPNSKWYPAQTVEPIRCRLAAAMVGGRIVVLSLVSRLADRVLKQTIIISG